MEQEIFTFIPGYVEEPWKITMAKSHFQRYSDPVFYDKTISKEDKLKYYSVVEVLATELQTQQVKIDIDNLNKLAQSNKPSEFIKPIIAMYNKNPKKYKSQEK